MNTKALRQKILDLAIHGKLVPQDPNDEPASVLLERIKAEKERLIKEGKIKRSKRSKAACDKPHYPYQLPKGWVWCKLEDIASIGTGATPLTKCKEYYLNGNIPWVNSSSTKDSVIESPSNYITSRAIQDTNCVVYPKGTLIVAMYGEGKTRGQVSELGIEAATNQACAAICPFEKEFKNYLKLFFESNYLRLRALAEGGTQPNLNLGKISNYEIPLPPLEEQCRIFTKIKHWISLIDVIENGKWNINETIKQAKSKILNLAIHGKLVPQDPTDEPAYELLKRINPKAEITCDNPQYENLPNGWCRCTLKDIGIFESGYAFSSDGYKQNGVPLVRISNITNNGNIDLSSCVYIQNYNNSKFIIHEGDLLIAMSGATTGKMGVYKYKTDALLNQRVGNLKCTEAWLQQYRNYFMLAKSNYILNIAYGGAQPNISAKAILSIKIDLPPIKEQHRIVAKIEELFTQLDKIEVSL